MSVSSASGWPGGSSFRRFCSCCWLAAWKFRGELGARNLYRLSAPSTEGREGKVEDERTATVLFGPDVSYAKLASVLSQGAEIRSTGLTDSFDFQDTLKQYGRRAIPLFATDARGRIRPFTVGSDWAPTDGWTVIGLIRPAVAKSIEGAEINPT